LYYRFIYRILLVACFIFCCPAVQAQTKDNVLLHSNIRNRSIAAGKSDSLLVDTLSVAVGSFTINVPDSSYTFYPEKALLVWKKGNRPAMDTLKLRYRVLPLSFTKKRTHKQGNLVDSNIGFPVYTYTLGDSFTRGFVNFNSIDYNGSYGRSLTIGNNQDVSLNSNLNLQLNGYILDSVRIEAAITDNNVPVQPDGNTQRLQEFDRIYITFEKGKHKLTAGDYNLEKPNSYFINFNKRVQGLMYETEFPVGSNIKNKLGLSGSIAKGQFARNIFQGSEGNQGPYKLTGNNGEQFFIVLAGSEKVYIDGLLLERGEDRDYVINYNTAEVTFMPRQLITKDKRIQVEFEYQDRNYLNTLIYAYDELQVGKKWNFRLNAYSNQDSKNQPYTQSLNGDQKRFLAGIGDNIDQAFYRVITEDTFSASKILYKIVDTTVNGTHYDTVFVYSSNKDSARYSLGFSFVGEGKGNYIISGTNTNGRSYSWIAPINGVPVGSYEPVVLLITPKKQQLFTLGTTYQVDSLKKITVELAASNYAPNLFSDLDKDKHWGFSGRALYEEQRFFGKKDSLQRQNISWKNQLSYEGVQSRFKAIAPYRNVEFARDWNLGTDVLPEDEHIITYGTELQKNRLGSIRYNLTWYQRGADYKANRNIISLLYERNNVRAGATFNLMNSNTSLQKSLYFRPSVFAEKTMPKFLALTIGAKYEKEHNAIRDAVTDQLALSSYAFDILTFYARTRDDRKTRIELNYTIRKDDAVISERFQQQNNAHTIDAKVGLYQFKDHQIIFTGAYRKLLANNVPVPGPGGGETVLGRLEYNGNIRKGFLVPSLLFELGSGQEQKREYTYVEVPTGQGVYMWNDYNKDGVQQANEFELAIYPDQRKYIRLVTPTNDYIKVNYVILNHSLQFNPEQLWAGKKERKKWQLFAGRFSDQLSLQINNRALSSAGLQSFNPFTKSINDTSIIASLTTISNTFFFNRSSAVWGMDYTFSRNAGKSLLTYGLEGNDQLRHVGKLRWTFFRSLTGNIQAQTGTRGYQSALNDGRTYKVTVNTFEPSLTWLLQSSFRLSASYKLDDRRNAPLYGTEKAVIQSLSLDSRISFASSGTIQARATYANITYNGAANTSLSFVMLDALQNGTNWLWYLNWERRLSKGIEISLEYEGRKPGDSPIVHTGRMSIRAIL
jgi:hypothetical protein